MRVYRGKIEQFETNTFFPFVVVDGVYYTKGQNVQSILQPVKGTIIHTGSLFETITGPGDVVANKYYRNDGVWSGTDYVKWTEITEQQAQANAVRKVFDIMEATYVGKDMGERKITATIEWPTPIDFHIGDYVEIQMQSLLRGRTGQDGSVMTERFYIYTEPQCKKTARSMMAGNAFETTVTFYPRQYELGCIQLRDFVQQKANADTIIYTGFDNVTFNGGAKELLDRCMACLGEHYKDNDGNPLWSYDLADTVNEEKNNSLERYAFSFQQAYIMDALLKLNDSEYVNTTFFINGRKIYVGYRRPYLCKVTNAGSIDSIPLNLMYGKTSHESISLDHGGLYDITKVVGDEVPITQLFAYGAARNLNRYYCSDRIKSGRYVNKLMLPSFSDDGQTDYILSQEGVQKYGIRQGSHDFEDIYPSLRYMTYEDIRGVKYCIKICFSGLDDDQWSADGTMEHRNSASRYAVARVQCYKVTPCTGTNGDGTLGVNKLVESAPPDDLAIFIHATGKTVKCVLYSDRPGKTALQRQIEHDGVWSDTNNGRVPAHTYHGNDYIPGSCFCVHDNGWADPDGTTHTAAERDDWFNTPVTSTVDTDSELHRIEYVDTFWATDLYVFQSYDQTYFQRDGYSLWAWPRLNNESGFGDSLYVNEVVAVEPVIIVDTSDNEATRQKTWDIYLRDVGFQIDEQNDFGEMVFVYDTVKVSMLDGTLTGREFTIDGGKINDFTDRCVCAYNADGTLNSDFLNPDTSGTSTIAAQAIADGAIWRLRLNRLNDEELESLGIILPTKELCAKAGDHVVFLDIYMPDIYIRAAEQRLLREARKYLDRNDRGNVEYAINFDKVRIQQIPNYALQMREGLNMRLKDADLNIASENRIRMIVDNGVGNQYDVSLYTTERNVNTEIVRYEDTKPHYKFMAWRYKNYDDNNQILHLSYPRYGSTSQFKSITLELSGIAGNNNYKETVTMQVSAVSTSGSGRFWEIFVHCSPGLNLRLTEVYNIKAVYEQEEVSVEEYTYSNKGALCNALCNEIVDFIAGKFYEVVVDVQPEFLCSEDVLMVATDSQENVIYAYRRSEDDVNGYYCFMDSDVKYYTLSDTPAVGDTVYVDDNGVMSEWGIITEMHTERNQFFISRSKDGVESFTPDYTLPVESISSDDVPRGFVRLVYIFYLDESFNDSTGYYPIVRYVADGETEYAQIRLVSVTEKDIDEQGNIVDFVDFVADEVSIKITDNTRGPETRIMPVYPEPIREISAKITEKTHASTWQQVMSRIGDVEIDTEVNKATYEHLANTARRNYRSLLELRNSIFDPDTNTNSKCDYNFLHIMMLQVGADSMNYQLEKTFLSAAGVPSNFSVDYIPGASNQYFSVEQKDTLHHFVYTEGAQGGKWDIPGGFSSELAPVVTTENNVQTTSWPTYFICIRCTKDGDNDMTFPAWICSQHQYAVNQETDPETGLLVDHVTGELMTNYWFFNWGILVCPEQDGKYKLMETRGNAYMYGDNIIAGKLSSLADNSYFDLTHGTFVLSKGTGGAPALSYINGVLTIAGINDGTEESVLERLHLLETEAIGGDNLCIWEDGKWIEEREYDNSGTGTDVKQLFQTKTSSQNVVTYTYVAAGKYIFSAKEIYAYIFQQSGVPSSLNHVSLYLQAIDNNGNEHKSETISNSKTSVTIETTVSCYFRIKYDYTYSSGERLYIRMQGVMLQSGTKATSYQGHVQHIIDALHGSTEIAGGITMTNILLLKDENKNVVAGMSGMADTGIRTVIDEHGSVVDKRSEGVSMFSGGTYQQALDQATGLLSASLPILLTKTGIRSRIGCFEVISSNSVAIYDEGKSNRIVLTSGVSMSIVMQKKVSNKWIDVLIINSDDIDYQYDIRTLGTPNAPIVLKEKTETTSEYLVGFYSDSGTPIKKIQVPANCKCDLSSSHRLFISILSEYGSWYNNHVSLYGTVKLVKVNSGGTYDVIATHTISGQETSFKDDNSLGWRIVLTGFNASPYTIQNAGDYGILLTIDHFYRENGAGVGYEEHMYNGHWSGCVLSAYIEQDIHFSKTSAEDRTIMKIGRNGMLIAHSATSYFLAKNDQTSIDIRMGGLPTQSDTSKPNSIYKSGGYLMIN